MAVSPSKPNAGASPTPVAAPNQSTYDIIKNAIDYIRSAIHNIRNEHNDIDQKVEKAKNLTQRLSNVYGAIYSSEAIHHYNLQNNWSYWLKNRYLSYVFDKSTTVRGAGIEFKSPVAELIRLHKFKYKKTGNGDTVQTFQYHHEDFDQGGANWIKRDRTAYWRQRPNGESFFRIQPTGFNTKLSLLDLMNIVAHAQAQNDRNNELKITSLSGSVEEKLAIYHALRTAGLEHMMSDKLIAKYGQKLYDEEGQLQGKYEDSGKFKEITQFFQEIKSEGQADPGPDIPAPSNQPGS